MPPIGNVGDNVSDHVRSGERYRAEQAVICELAGQHYGLAIDHVREVLPRAALTPLPEAPPVVAGILRLRGSLLPVLDLRQRLGLPVGAPRISDRIVVTQVDGLTIGLLVEAVLGVQAVPDTSIGVTPAQASAVVRRIAELPDGPVALLNVAALVEPGTAALLAVVGHDRRSDVIPQQEHAP